MKNKTIQTIIKTRGKLVILISIFLLISTFTFAQSTLNFTAEWELNKTKSTRFMVDLLDSERLTIIQDVNSITFRRAFKPHNYKLMERKEIYNLNDSEIVTKSDDKTQKLSASWLPDKQSFTITTIINYTINGIIKESKRIETYTLSDNGNILVVNYNNILPDGSLTPMNERNYNMVYDKVIQN
jgi:hypothetical protein